jgi:hypothetical protein
MAWCSVKAQGQLYLYIKNELFVDWIDVAQERVQKYGNELSSSVKGWKFLDQLFKKNSFLWS